MAQTILERAKNRESFEDLDIIDIHCHMGNYSGFEFPDAGIDPMMEDARKMGVRRVCVVAQVGTSNAYRAGNINTLRAAERYPDRVLGYVALNPHMAWEAEDELRTYYPNDGFVGVKIHPGAMQAKANCKGYRKIFDLVQAYGGYVLVHTWEDCPYSNIDLCGDVMKDYPEIPFVLGHAGGTVEGVKKALRLANRLPNIYLDCCGFDVTEHSLPELAERMQDPFRLLYGSDYPFHDLRYGLTRVLFADLDDSVKRGILSSNAEELLRRSPKRLKH